MANSVRVQEEDEVNLYNATRRPSGNESKRTNVVKSVSSTIRDIKATLVKVEDTKSPIISQEINKNKIITPHLRKESVDLAEAIPGFKESFAPKVLA